MLCIGSNAMKSALGRVTRNVAVKRIQPSARRENFLESAAKMSRQQRQVAILGYVEVFLVFSGLELDASLMWSGRRANADCRKPLHAHWLAVYGCNDCALEDV